MLCWSVCKLKMKGGRAMLKGLQWMILIGCLGLIACSHAGASGMVIGNPPTPETPSLLPSTSKYIANIGGRRVQFQASMWQNLMPQIDGEASQGSIYTNVSANGISAKGLPPGFDITGVRVWRGKKVYWKGELVRNGESDGEASIVRNGSGAFALPSNRRVNLTVLYKIGKRKGSVTIPNIFVGAAY